MSEDKFEQATFKIFQLTHEGKLNWEKMSAPDLWGKGSDSVYPLCFATIYQGRKLGLYQRRKPKGFQSKGAVRVWADMFADDKSDWQQEVRLALLGDSDEIMFEFPPSRQVNALFDAVRYKEANVEGFLDELLKTESQDIK
jgi:hypothetical protein